MKKRLSIIKLGAFLITAVFIVGAVGGTVYLFKDQFTAKNISSLMATVTNSDILEKHDQITVLLLGLKEKSNLSLSQIGQTDFIWKFEDGDEVKEFMVDGKGISVESVAANDISIKQYLKNNGFFADILNTAEGTVGSLHAFREGGTVCLISEIVTGFDVNNPDDLPTDRNYKDIEVQCGRLDSEIITSVSKDGLIKKLFAKKYNIPVSEINLTFNQEVDRYARGLVQIGEPGPGSSGLFLAAKIEGEWEIIFDGNGSFSCSNMRGYGFPEYMISDCEEDIERTGFMPKEEDIIKTMLSKKLWIASSSLLIRFEQQTDDHMRGTWHLTNKEKEMRTFLAVLNEEEWVIAYDGRSVMNCDKLIEFDFPILMIMECHENR
ncbi:hypothetical protein K8R32_03890 [bacterium]|nr:hypothetical protein [bacterium]